MQRSAAMLVLRKGVWPDSRCVDQSRYGFLGQQRFLTRWAAAAGSHYLALRAIKFVRPLKTLKHISPNTFVPVNYQSATIYNNKLQSIFINHDNNNTFTLALYLHMERQATWGGTLIDTSRSCTEHHTPVAYNKHGNKLNL
jgi:hypothetical protein